MTLISILILWLVVVQCPTFNGFASGITELWHRVSTTRSPGRTPCLATVHRTSRPASNHQRRSG